LQGPCYSPPSMGLPFETPEKIGLQQQEGQSFPRLVAIMQRLLAEDGCPWDREQTIQTLRYYLQEETCEVIDAIDRGSFADLCEELGDLSLIVVFLSELARNQGYFGPDDVVREVITKLVRRHPHVFSDGDAATAADVERAWEAIKAEEKKRRPLLDNIPRSLPALDGARRVSERVATVGFDWDDHSGSRAKVAEELGELDEAAASGDAAAIEHELGDTLFALVNYARHLGVDPEVALRKTSARFRGRFEHVEREVKRVHGDWPRRDGKPSRGIGLAELDGYWADAKRIERNGGEAG
ncbi:MAG TPA: nucleoside triphosphate pyrophosphohydrolase, partial [Polyangiaceae bacterium]|nr:nucleoside triphosphate pyrophosphohydrolase [Polyangiaceae bacterium]